MCTISNFVSLICGRYVNTHIIIYKYYNCIHRYRSVQVDRAAFSRYIECLNCRYVQGGHCGWKKCIWILLLLLLLCIIILLCAPRMGRPVCCCCVSENRGTYLYNIYALNIPTGGGVVSRSINP